MGQKKQLRHYFADLLGPRILGIIDYYRLPQFRNSWGGAFNGQEHRQAMFSRLVERFGFSAIVETGTFRGTTLEYLASFGKPVYSAELHPRYHWFCRTRFFRNPNVSLSLADSRPFLKETLTSLADTSGDLMIYLDAHWGDNLPLREELEIIFQRRRDHSLILIDDFNVPGDDGYGFDDYGEKTGVLKREYIQDILDQHRIRILFPKLPSEQETGMKRGCCLLIPEERLSELDGITDWH